MAFKQSKHIFQGLNKDLANDKTKANFYIDAHNIRITAREDGSLLAVTNEKGNTLFRFNESLKQSDTIQGNYLGHGVINNYIILFTHDANNYDYIYRLDINNKNIKRLFAGNLEFDINHPIETLVSYETEDIQKVYWIDGINQPRYINIAPILDNEIENKPYINTSFDFSGELNLSETVDITRINNNGLFAPGTLQYFMTYFNKNGKESKIFYQSHLLYTSKEDRGAKSDETCENSFKITITKPDTNWEYVRIYSALRTSTDTDILARKVIDLKLTDSIEPVGNFITNYTIFNVNESQKNSITNDRNNWLKDISSLNNTIYIYKGNEEMISLGDSLYIKIPNNNIQLKVQISITPQTPGRLKRTYELKYFYNDNSLFKLYSNQKITFTDTGNYGETINATELLLLGAENITAETIAQKDGTLFLGNIKLKENLVSNDTIKLLQGYCKDDLSWTSTLICKNNSTSTVYDYTNRLANYGYNENYIVENKSLAGFKANETYRFGLQFQDSKGKWSQPIWLCDSKNINYPEVDNEYTIQYIPYKSFSNIPSLTKFKRVRPVVVLPEEYEREVLCQGVLNPTIFNGEDRYNNAPYAQPSWFYRAIPPNNYTANSLDYELVSSDINKGSYVAFRHGEPIYGGTSRCSEFSYGLPTREPISSDKNNEDYSIYCTINNFDNNITTWLNTNKEHYYVDTSIITLDCPEAIYTELPDDLSNYTFNIIGAVNIASSTGRIDLLNSASTPDPYFPGVYTPVFSNSNTSDKDGWKILLNAPAYMSQVSSSTEYDKSMCGYVVAPWQDIKLEGGNFIKNKIIANFRYCNKTIYSSNPQQYNIKDCRYINSKISANTLFQVANDLETKTYYIKDKVNISKNNSFLITSNVVHYKSLLKHILVHRKYNLTLSNNSIRPYICHKEINDNVPADINFIYKGIKAGRLSETHYDPRTQIISNHNKTILDFNESQGEYITSADALFSIREDLVPSSDFYPAIHINYTPNSHILISLDSTDNSNCCILPYNEYPSNDTTIKKYDIASLDNTKALYENDTHYSGNKSNEITYAPFYNKNITKWKQEEFTINGITGGSFYIGELSRTVLNKFGGTSAYALENNKWLVGGPAKNITFDNQGYASFDIVWTEGDTYFQRFNSLKTSGAEGCEENQIIEVLSYLCETRINLDGTYDKIIGSNNILNITRDNYNQLNLGYTQKDNIFSYNILDKSFELSTFPNQITWTKSKIFGDLNDSWTNITLVNTLDLDGSKGKLVSLNRYNNEIYAFQDSGIAQIIYNPNVQINSKNNLPIEIVNSGKVEGKRYISESIGCQNKWSIIESKNGLYFVDKFNNSIYLYSQGLSSITDKAGLRSWMKNTTNNFRTYYDTNNSDLYFITGNECLVYSELLDQFTSFMDYNKADTLFNVNNDFYSFYTVTGESTKLWKHFIGDYNNFYGEIRPYWITFKVNDNSEYNKVFTNIEYRSDMYDSDILDSFNTFDTIRVNNEYQDTGEVSIHKLLDKPSLLAKKFRVWRIQIPRDKSNYRDRIQNTWTDITLKHTNLDNKKLILYDTLVGYYI